MRQEGIGWFWSLRLLIAILVVPSARGGQEVVASSKDDFDKGVTAGANDKTCSVTVSSCLHTSIPYSCV
eukprot:SAG31_NODE_14242_length_819_cov_0.679167_1_plen_68_part_01